MHDGKRRGTACSRYTTLGVHANADFRFRVEPQKRFVGGSGFIKTNEQTPKQKQTRKATYLLSV